MKDSLKKYLIVISGIVVGLLALFLYFLRFHTYMGDEPSTCINCHIMTPWYATWSHSSHSRDATCNDCHVPHGSMAAKYAFKGMDGIKHTSYFLTRSEGQTIFIKNAGARVVMNNCIRCHTQLNQEFVKTGRIDYMMAQVGQGKACWDCHRNVPHANVHSLDGTPGAEFVVPNPPGGVPAWLEKAVSHK